MSIETFALIFISFVVFVGLITLIDIILLPVAIESIKNLIKPKKIEKNDEDRNIE